MWERDGAGEVHRKDGIPNMSQIIQQDTHTVIITGYKTEDVQVTAESVRVPWVAIASCNNYI